MRDRPAAPAPGAPPSSLVRTFLIADLRGYTRYTDQHGDEASAKISERLAALAGDVIVTWSGVLVETRGDEVLAAFDSPRDGIRAAVALQMACTGATEEGQGLTLPVGIGLDAGEAVALDGGYRGRALNMAARLCARARPGEILVTPELVHLAGSVEGVAFEERGPVHLKGLTRPTNVNAVKSAAGQPRADEEAPPAGQLEFRILGPLEVQHEGRPVPVGGSRQRLVLALLLLRANQIVSMDQLIDKVWDDDPPKSARNTIQSYVSHLRTALGVERVEGRAPGYVLHIEPDELDVSRFERALRRARRQLSLDPEQAVVSFEQAIMLWRGSPLADLESAESLAGERSRLDELRVTAIEDLIGARLALGQHAEVIPELESLLVEHPLRERLWAHLVLALYRSGRQAEAIGALSRVRELLADQLGIDPSPELRELQERVLHQDPSLELKGRPLRSYRLLEQIGEGAFGTVWRALDPGIGREVAVKQIHPLRAGDPSFARRFDQEAQIIARLEHPHVVPLYDSWRDGTGAYLVMRWMRGGSLAALMGSRRIATAECVSIVDHVASALSAAHRRNLVHRDVKPENVLLDEDGNAYLSDFGIAQDMASAPPGSTGSTGSVDTGYRSPEELLGEDPTPRSDIFALGVVVKEMLLELPPSVDAVVARATAPDPKDRYADALEFAVDLRGALAIELPAKSPSTDEARNPYKGLRAFTEGDADDFFGRELQVERLLARLEDGALRFLSVVGPSGSGKSSLVRAGLLPALRAGVLSGSERWFYAEMLPGPRPMEELESALLRVAVSPPASLIEQLESDEDGLTRAVSRILPEGTDLLLVVDQFEEVFTLVEDERARASFLEVLAAAVSDPQSRLRVVATLRADYYDRPLSYPVLVDLVRAGTEIVVPLSAEELERAIGGPAERVGVVPERALVAEIVADVTDQPGALPLLQFALTETFERRQEGVITLEAYRETGGVTGALARRAEHLFKGMNQAGREAVRQLFLRLVTIGEGAEDTRRLVPRSELASLEVDIHALDGVVDAFGRHRLLSFDRDPDTRGPTVEVAHEALLREWTRLRGWIDASREDVIMHRRLVAEADDWQRAGRDPSFLLRGSRLIQFEAWSNNAGLALAAAEREYLRESLLARDIERGAEEARLSRERSLEQRSVVRMRALVAVLAVAALIASSLTIVAVGQRGRAQRAAREATARGLAAAAIANLGQDAGRSIRLAVQAVQTTRSVDGSVLPEAEEALHRAVQADRVLLSIPAGSVVRFSPDGLRLISNGREPGTAQVFDSRTGKVLVTLTGHGTDVISHVGYSPDGRFLSTASRSDASTAVWNARTGRRLRTLRVPSGDKVCCWDEFSPDGSLLATDVWNQGVHVWDLRTGKVVDVFPNTGGAKAFSPDGTRLWIGSCVHVLKPKGGPGGFCVNEQVSDVSWSSDGSRVAASSDQGTVVLWDATTGRELMTLVVGNDPGDIELAPGGRRLAIGFADGTVSVWDLTSTSAQQAFVVASHDSSIRSMKFSPDGRHLATASDDNVVSVLDVRPNSGGESLTTQSTGAVAYLANDRVAIGGTDAKVTIVDPTTGEPVKTLSGARNADVMDVAADATGTRVAASWWDGVDGTVRVWDLASGPPLMTLRHLDFSFLHSVELTPDGKLLLTVTNDGRARVWDVSTRTLVGTIRNVFGPATFSHDGRFLATVVSPSLQTGEAVTVWRVDPWSRVAAVHHSDWSHALAFSADDRRLFTAGLEGAVYAWDARTLAVLPTLSGNPGSVWGMDASSDGRLLATASGRGIELWDLSTGRELYAVATVRTSIFANVAFSPDGSHLIGPSEAGNVSVYSLQIDDLLKLASMHVSGGLSARECQQYLHEATCPA